MMGLASGALELILIILFWVLVVVAALWLVSRLFPQASNYTLPPYGGGSDPDRDSSLEILKQRYARGEISKSEYLEMRNTLRH